MDEVILFGNALRWHCFISRVSLCRVGVCFLGATQRWSGQALSASHKHLIAPLSGDCFQVLVLELDPNLIEMNGKTSVYFYWLWIRFL